MSLVGLQVRGATTHYEAVVNGATSGVLGASTSTGTVDMAGTFTFLASLSPQIIGVLQGYR